MKITPPTVATSLVRKFTMAANSSTRKIRPMPSGTSYLPTLDVERHLVLAAAGLLEPQHHHRQRLEDEAPDHAEGVRLAQQDHVAPADHDREELQPDDQVQEAVGRAVPGAA